MSNTTKKKCDCFICNGLFTDWEEECDCPPEFDSKPLIEKTHTCVPKEYIGLIDRYFYCVDCGKKLN